MDVQMRSISEIRPYERNTKKHTQRQIKNVAESIKQYGFVQPLVVDSDGVIVIGHCRYSAACKLGMDAVPCVCVDDLTPEQVNALRIVDNKTNQSAWNLKNLSLELPALDLSAFDFGDTFTADRAAEEHEKGQNKALEIQERYNILDFDEYRAPGFYEMPQLKAVDFKPTRLVGFNYAKSTDEYDCGIHFYLDDYQFERVWNDPEKYIEILRPFECVLTPHYSVYADMAKPIKIYNTFRGKLLGQMMQDAGLTVIPTVYWGDESSYDYSFEGLPENGTLSIYTMNWNTDEWSHEISKNGLIALLERKKPKRLLVYGNGVKIEDVDFGDCEVVYYRNEVTERMKENVERKQ